MVVEVDELGIVTCLASALHRRFGQQKRVAVAAWARAQCEYFYPCPPQWIASGSSSKRSSAAFIFERMGR
jgi:hypothetical protein